MKWRKLLYFGLLLLCFTLYLNSQNKVYATWAPTSKLYMTQERAQAILDYFKSGNNYKFYQYGTSFTSEQKIYDTIDQFSSTDLMNKWNNDIADVIQQSEIANYGINWDNIFIVGYSRDIHRYNLAFYIAQSGVTGLPSDIGYLKCVNSSLANGGYQDLYGLYNSVGNIYTAYMYLWDSGEIESWNSLNKNTSLNTLSTSSGIGQAIYNTETTIADIPGIFANSRVANIYFSYADYSNQSPYFLKNYYQYIEPTPTPSGDNSGDSGNGENTGNIDLSNIEQGITNINNNIVQGNNQIVSAIQQQNEEYWGTSGELTINEQSGEINNMLNEINDNISGELTNNEIYETLQTAEQGILEIFEYGRNNPLALDFILKWNEIKYNNTILIPGSRGLIWERRRFQFK